MAVCSVSACWLLAASSPEGPPSPGLSADPSPHLSLNHQWLNRPYVELAFELSARKALNCQSLFCSVLSLLFGVLKVAAPLDSKVCVCIQPS